MAAESRNPQRSALRDLMQLASVALVLKDDDGYYLAANAAAEELFGYTSTELAGKHMTELCPVDPRMVEMAFQQLKRDRIWNGRFPLRRKQGDFIEVECHSFVRTEEDGSLTYPDLVYPVTGATNGGSKAAQVPGPGELTPLDVGLLQLMVEGFTDDQIAVLFGISPDVVTSLVRDAIRDMSARSRTEACVLAIKSNVVR